MRALLIALLGTAVPALCQQPTATESTPHPQHLDVTAVDRSIDPCVNFQQYVCSKTIAANPIPPDEMFAGTASRLMQWNRQILREILEKAQAPLAARTPNEQKIGDFYASCVSQAESGANEISAIQPLLARIQRMSDKRDISPILAAIHNSFGRSWQGGDNQADVALFGYGPQSDYNDVSRVVAGIDQGGLGMPGRDFYLSADEHMVALRARYRSLLSTLLQLDGSAPADAERDASTVLRIETAMAQSQMDNITRRDPNRTNNRYNLAQLKQLTPAFDWDSYFHALNAPAVPLYEVTAPDFFRAMNELLLSEGLPAWKVYLRAHLLLVAAPYLGNSWRDANFKFFSAITGQPQQPPSWRRCTTSTDEFLGEALGQVYVEQNFPPESKARARQMIHDIEAAMSRDIDVASWMNPATKQQAHLKLTALVEKIGYPDKWIDYASLSITRQSYAANVERATAFELQRQLTFIGKPLDRTQWLMTPPTVDAYEDPQTNTINFPAGILQPPFFDSTQDDVVNYGASGAIMGHELTHDFDDQGRKFDANGNLRDWWTPDDAKQYEARDTCIAAEYTGPVPGLSDIRQNGKLTQGEDTADNGGIYLALSALSEDLKRHGKTLQDKDAEGLTTLQRFFIAYANSWCETFRPELMRTLVMTNPHSVPELRVNNVVSNMPEFQEAFACRAGQPMVHSTRCRVW